MTSGFGVPRGAVPAPSPERDPLRPGTAEAVPDRLDALIDAGACWKPALSPDGRSVAFIADDAGCPQLFLSPVGLWAPRRVTTGPHEVVDVSWSRDGGLIGYAVAPRTGGPQLCVAGADGGNPRPMFVAHNESAFPGCWTPDGRAFAFSTTLGSVAGGCTVYLLDLTASTLLPLAPAHAGDGHVTVADISGNRTRVLLQDASGGPAAVTLVDRAVRRRVPLTPPLGTLDGASVVEVDRPCFDASARTVFVRVRLAPDEISDTMRTALAAVALDEVGDPVAWQLVASRRDAALAGYALAGDRSVAVLCWQTGGFSELEVWTLGGARQPVVLPIAGTVGSVSVNESGTSAVFDLSAPREPRSLWRLDVVDGRVARLGLPPGSVPPQAALIAPELVTVSTAAGSRAQGWLFRPGADRRTGAAVVGLPDDPAAPSAPVYSALHQCLLDLGIAVFVPRPAASDDLAAAVGQIREVAAALLEVGIVDAGRLGIYGIGAGGSLAAASSAAAPDLFAAAVDVCGSRGLDGLLPGTAGPAARETGTDGPMAARTPTLVIHGGHDGRMPLPAAEQVVDALAARQIPVELLVLDDDGDVRRARPAQRQSTAAAVGWFRDHLVGRPGEPRLDGDRGIGSVHP